MEGAFCVTLLAFSNPFGPFFGGLVSLMLAGIEQSTAWFTVTDRSLILVAAALKGIFWVFNAAQFDSMRKM